MKTAASKSQEAVRPQSQHIGQQLVLNVRLRKIPEGFHINRSGTEPSKPADDWSNPGR